MAASAGAATSGGPVSPPRSPRFEISPPSSRSLALLHFVGDSKALVCLCAGAVEGEAGQGVRGQGAVEGEAADGLWLLIAASSGHIGRWVGAHLPPLLHPLMRLLGRSFSLAAAPGRSDQGTTPANGAPLRPTTQSGEGPSFVPPPLLVHSLLGWHALLY